MENNAMGLIRSCLVGMAMGTAITAGEIYMNENNITAKKAMNKAKASKRIITRAGENIVKEIKE